MTHSIGRIAVLSFALMLSGAWAVRAQDKTGAMGPLSPEAPIGVQVTARATAVIAAPMAGQLVEFPAVDGDAVRKDEVLARFNCAQQEAMLARARAELVKRQDLLATQKALKALNAYSKADFTTAQNDVEVAKAELALAQTAIDNCVIKAPFSGRVANAPVRNFQFVQAGTTLLDIVDDRDLELEFIVPSVWLRWLKPNTPAHVQVTETQQPYEARITRISGKVDAASQTIKIYGRIESGDTTALLPGMSGIAHFDGAEH
jgi:membrane fusion protein (multidrug efflux system)